MDTIYAEMTDRNRAWLAHTPWRADPHLLDPTDSRRCIAVVAEGTWTRGPDWPALDAAMSTVRERSPTGAWLAPRLHHTFVCLRPWGRTGDFDTFEVTDDLRQILAAVPPYEIAFDRVIPVQTGIALCGTPSIDVNAVREHLRSRGHVIGERYKLDICHATLLRSVATIPMDIQRDILATVLPAGRGSFLSLAVDRMHVCEASWCLLREEEVELFATISLDGTDSDLVGRYPCDHI